ncbi:gluconate 5-dehydrogenase [Rhodohalobacter sp. SW132]|uniref:gluconate 5-dehydrogenase n=1 Tax=Rhodohalobacter sp. SW132 TaxID=2293433 RepID=UPI000E2239C7|nr:gluconate 5-dehydrogenase [Rhodohalobacter sp. SW132]REL33171.1 gluconate 5-dehydrogenase [Rhodohalobacter sp. SW132]
MSSLFDLSGKRALVTGATHGLGMAMAKGLAEAGAELIINGTTPSRMENAVEEYEREGYEVHSFLFDVTDEKKAAEHVDQVEKEIGPINILVNNAGIIKRMPLKDMDVQEYRKVIDVDLTGPFIMAKQVVRHMIPRNEGKIINICSMMTELGRDTVGAYAAAKGGLKMLTKSMATEWARYNIQANGIGPGYFATSQTEPIRKDGHPFNDFIINRTPAGRWGDPSDLAGTAVFLSSKASDFVNGQIIYVDGGILATIGKPANED